MEPDVFWAIMQTLGPHPSDEDFERLTDHLATRSTPDVIGFEDRLAALLHALDTPAHAAAARARGDWFLYVRCAAVAAGRDAYQQVLARPATLKRFARQEAEHLLFTAGNADERRTGMLWEHEPAISYGSGSNTAAWGESEPPPEAPEPAAPVPWLRLRSTTFLPGGWPAAYDHLVDHVAQAITADPAWQAWWSTTGIPECHLTLIQHDNEEFGPTGATVKVGRTRIEATAAWRPAPFPGAEPEQVLPRAIDDVTRLFGAVRTQLAMAPLPPLNLAELPANLPKGLEHPTTAPQILAKVGVANLLKAAAAVIWGRLRRDRTRG
jgi:hypothetical protein